MGGIMYGDVAEEDALGSLRTYLNAGGNFIDTARVYRTSEGYVGRAVAEFNRGEVFIATKTQGTDPDRIRADTEESLRHLRTDVIDLQFLHDPPDDPESADRAIAALETLKKEGKIRSIIDAVFDQA